MGFEKEMLDYANRKTPLCIENDTISGDLFKEYGVNRGLRDVNGKGVLTGLTNISEIISFKDINGEKHVPCEGELWYRGYNVRSLVQEYGWQGFGFEKCAYLLLFGELPDDQSSQEFIDVLARSRNLPTNFTRDVIMVICLPGTYSCIILCLSLFSSAISCPFPAVRMVLFLTSATQKSLFWDSGSRRSVRQSLSFPLP